MPEIQQPDILGNYLSAYNQQQDRNYQQQARQQAMDLNMRADQRAADKFKLDMDSGQLKNALDRVQAEIDFFGNLPPNINDAQWEQAKQTYSSRFGVPLEQIAGRRKEDLPALRDQSGATLRALQIEATKARIGTEQAQAASYNRANRGGGPADPELRPLTHDQGLAAGFAERLITANEYFKNSDVSKSLKNPLNKYVSAIPIAGNYLTSTEFQQGDQASRDFINAQLRRESGAVIGPTEFANANLQYLPQPGDGPEVLAQKAKAREIAVYNMLKAAGPQFSERAAAFMPKQSAPVDQQPPPSFTWGGAAPGGYAAGSQARNATPSRSAPTARTGSTSPPFVRSKQEFDALPSGSIYVEPDGKRYRKP